MIINCTCSHEFQDREYGKGRRVGNKIRKKDPLEKTKYRCTVCGEVK